MSAPRRWESCATNNQDLVEVARGLEPTYLLHLVLSEVWNTVDDDPGQRTAKVKDLVDEERHDTRGQDVVTHPCVPGQPHLLKVVELDIVLGDLLEGAPVGVLRHGRQNRGCVPVASVNTRRSGCLLVGTYMVATCEQGQKSGSCKLQCRCRCLCDWVCGLQERLSRSGSRTVEEKGKGGGG